ncbi:unnamed protein product, partial [Strongylus vulgaris]
MDPTPASENNPVDVDNQTGDVKPSVSATVYGIHSMEVIPPEISKGTNVFALPEVAELGQSADTIVVEGDGDPTDIQNVLSEVISLRHAKQNIEEELLDVKEKCKELSARNSELQSQIASSIEDLNERSRLYRQLESSRNDLARTKMDLDCDIERLKHEKEERDNAIRTLTKEKQLIA